MAVVGFQGAARVPLSFTVAATPAGFPTPMHPMPPTRAELIDCISNVEALRDEEHTGALPSSVPERAEVGRHRADIV